MFQEQPEHHPGSALERHPERRHAAQRGRPWPAHVLSPGPVRHRPRSLDGLPSVDAWGNWTFKVWSPGDGAIDSYLAVARAVSFRGICTLRLQKISSKSEYFQLLVANWDSVVLLAHLRTPACDSNSSGHGRRFELRCERVRFLRLLWSVIGVRTVSCIIEWLRGSHPSIKSQPAVKNRSLHPL